MKLENNFITKPSRVFIIAELSANHNGSLETAIKTIKAAKKAGADCIKFQTYTADTITINCRKPDFFIKGTLWEGKNLYDLYKEAYTPWEWHEQLFLEAAKEDIICFSSPFDKTAVDFLEKLNTPAYKISSFEITDIPLIEYIASKGKPMIISTGIAMCEDIELALDACYRMNNYDVTLLKCTSTYPATIEDANLLTIQDMRQRYKVKVGLSDHTMGSEVAIASVVMGVEIIEKHFIIDRSIGGPDCEFSMNQEEFASMVNSIRKVEKAIGKVTYPSDPKTIKGRQFCRSLYVVEDIKAGEIFTLKNVRSIRPGFGLHPKYLKEVLGKKASVDLKKGEPMKINFLK